MGTQFSSPMRTLHGTLTLPEGDTANLPDAWLHTTGLGSIQTPDMRTVTFTARNLKPGTLVEVRTLMPPDAPRGTPYAKKKPPFSGTCAARWKFRCGRNT